jgi:hypothetical protein
MDDEKLVQLVNLYLDGELTGVRRIQRWQITRKRGNCAKTQTCFEFEATYRQVIVSKCHDTPPPDLQSRIAAALGLPGTETPPAGDDPLGQATDL